MGLPIWRADARVDVTTRGIVRSWCATDGPVRLAEPVEWPSSPSHVRRSIFFFRFVHIFLCACSQKKKTLYCMGSRLGYKQVRNSLTKQYEPNIRYMSKPSLQTIMGGTNFNVRGINRIYARNKILD